MIGKDSKKNEKNEKKYCCIICHFNTCKKTDYQRHILTDKHKNQENDSVLVGNDSNFTTKNDKLFQCICGKSYKYDSGLYRHKKKCKMEKDKEEQNNINLPEKELQVMNECVDKDQLIIMLLKQNTELIEILKNGTHNTTNNTTTNTNSNNKSFNLNFFLNETCKDAMNITDFVDSIKLQLSDLENVGELGYVQGISNIITTHLKALDVEKRPIHCTDKKRETLYIKDENKWEKEDENNNKLRKAIKKVSNKNVTLIQEFKNKYPDCIRSTSRHSDKYNKIIIEAMGGPGDNDHEKEDKIIKNISKATIIDKFEL